MLLTLLLALQSPLAAVADTLPRAHNALHYDITLVVGDTGGHILGEVQTTWRLGSAEPVVVQLDSALRVVRVLVDGKADTRMSRTQWARGLGDVEIPHSKAAGDSMQTRVRYRGWVRDGFIIGKNSYGARTAFADNWPDRAQRWLPVQDHPSDKATVAFHVQVPPDFQVIANGTLQKVDTLPYRHLVWHYRMDRPIPVYTFVVGVAKLRMMPVGGSGCPGSCLPISVWTYPEDSAYAVSVPFRRVREMVDFFSDRFGPFPYASLAHVESSTRFGGMENATAIFYDEEAYNQRKLSELTVAHETAHQWFGDAVTESDWHHLWLSEGFASYGAALWAEHVGGDSALRILMGRGAQAVFSSEATARPILDTAATDLMSLLNSNNYQKGAWVLHQLRGMVGDSVFFAGLREFYRAYRDSTALSSDFARVMSAAAGQDLEWYFSQALLQPGYPELDVRWKHTGGKLELVVRQTQSSGGYRLPGVELQIDQRTVRIDIEREETRLTIPGVRSRPKLLALDPRHWWLMKSVVQQEKK